METTLMPDLNALLLRTLKLSDPAQLEAHSSPAPPAQQRLSRRYRLIWPLRALVSLPETSHLRCRNTLTLF
ncbi:MAG: hypothetical protein VBE63_30210 [Lamprobacter sp.]|uniref:hypothetical protein n=1 Tax=Lamprobacter sp. TaxID=3100796 RepID=UPI002B259E83|nr:hypothetical protein [Lamprobacter sp.]MEA3644165.1 hypothetical protein [Lamprobacter sp.]